MNVVDEGTILTNFFGNYPIVKVIDFLIENRGFDYTKAEIAEHSEIGIATLHQMWDKIEKYGIIKETRKYGNTKLYMINDDSELVNMIKQLILKIAKEELTTQKKKVIA